MEKRFFKTSNEDKTQAYKKLKFEEAFEFMKEYGTAEEKSEFKKACSTTKDGKPCDSLNWLNGKRWFCKNFAPDLLPDKKKKTKLDMMKDW
jgi:hypothetical protein